MPATAAMKSAERTVLLLIVNCKSRRFWGEGHLKLGVADRRQGLQYKPQPKQILLSATHQIHTTRSSPIYSKIVDWERQRRHVTRWFDEKKGRTTGGPPADYSIAVAVTKDDAGGGAPTKRLVCVGSNSSTTLNGHVDEHGH